MAIPSIHKRTGVPVAPTEQTIENVARAKQLQLQLTQEQEAKKPETILKKKTEQPVADPRTLLPIGHPMRTRQLKTGEYVFESQYAELGPEDREKLEKVGVEEFTKEKEEKIKRDYHKLDTGELVLKTNYTFWPDKMKEVANREGVSAVSLEGLSGQTKVNRMKELGIIDKTIKNPIYLSETDKGEVSYKEAPWQTDTEKVKLWSDESDLLSDKTKWGEIKRAIARSQLETPEGAISATTPLRNEPGFFAKFKERDRFRPEWFDNWYGKLPDEQKLLLLGNYRTKKEVSLQTADAAASMVPIVGTIKDWNDMSTTWKGLSIAGDVLFLSPLIRSGITAANKSLKAARGIPELTTKKALKAEREFVTQLTRDLRRTGMTNTDIQGVTAISGAQSDVFRAKDNLKALQNKLANISKEPLPKSIAEPMRTKLKVDIEKAEKALEEANLRLTKKGFDLAKDVARTDTKILTESHPEELVKPLARERLEHFARSITKHTNELWDELQIPKKLTRSQKKDLYRRLEVLESDVRDSVNNFESGIFRVDKLAEQQKIRSILFNDELGSKLVAESGWQAARTKKIKALESKLEVLRRQLTTAETYGDKAGVAKLNRDIASVESQLNKENTQLLEKLWDYVNDSMETLRPATPDEGGRFEGLTGGVATITPVTPQITPRTTLPKITGKITSVPKSLAPKIGLFFKSTMYLGEPAITIVEPTGTATTYTIGQLQSFTEMTPAEIVQATPQETITSNIIQLVEVIQGKPIADTDTETLTNLANELMGELITGVKTDVIPEPSTKVTPETKTLVKTKLRLAYKTIMKNKTEYGHIFPSLIQPTEKERVKGEYEGGVAFQMGELRAGKVFHILVYPYGEQDYKIYVGDNPPHGVIVREDAQSALETVQQLYGITPKAKIDIGITDAEIKPGRGKKPSLRFTADPEQKTRHKYSAKRAKVQVEGKGESGIRRVR